MRLQGEAVLRRQPPVSLRLEAVEVARDPNLFKYLSACARAPVGIIIGDARLRLRDAPTGGYGLIVLDAFSSDAVPAHLMTREAMAL